jgi:regulatory protein
VSSDAYEVNEAPHDQVPSSSRTPDILHTAVRLLSGREHSQRELLQKLQQRGWSEHESLQCLAELVARDLQSDQRFAASFIRSRVSKAYGPMRIRLELKEKGVEREVIEWAFREEPVEWLQVASGWYERRFGLEPIADLKERAKRQQILLRRGFTNEMIRELLN